MIKTSFWFFLLFIFKENGNSFGNKYIFCFKTYDNRKQIFFWQNLMLWRLNLACFYVVFLSLLILQDRHLYSRYIKIPVKEVTLEVEARVRRASGKSSKNDSLPSNLYLSWTTSTFRCLLLLLLFFVTCLHLCAVVIFKDPCSYLCIVFYFNIELLYKKIQKLEFKHIQRNHIYKTWPEYTTTYHLFCCNNPTTPKTFDFPLLL